MKNTTTELSTRRRLKVYFEKNGVIIEMEQNNRAYAGDEHWFKNGGICVGHDEFIALADAIERAKRLMVLA